jgi:hypothetical protein
LIRYSTPAFSSRSSGRRFLSANGMVVIRAFGMDTFAMMICFRLH